MADTQQGRQVGFDRLKRRLDNYRTHDSLNSSHFEATVDTIYGDQRKQTHVLKQRHIESKIKKPKKSSDNKKNDSSILGSMGQSKLLARGHDQTTGPGDTLENEPASKKQRLVNGSIVTSVAADISDFQIVQTLRNIKNNSSPIPITPNNGNHGSGLSNPSSSTIPQDLLEGLSDSALGVGNDSDDIKKESDIDIPNDSLLEDLGELGSFEDIDMGINLADFVHDLDLDNIKHENSNPGIESFFKEEIGDVYDDPSNISSDSGLANSGSNGQLSSQPMSKINTNPSSVPSYSHYSNAGTPPNSHSSTPPSFAQNSFSSIQQTSFNSIPCTTNSLSNPYSLAPTIPKMRMNNMTVGQSDLAAQALKQMAEQHQTKLSPTGNPVRSNLGDYSYNNMAGTPMMGQSVSVSNQMYNNTLNQTNPMFNQSIGSDIELKRRQQQMMQQYSMQQMQHSQSNVSGHCNQQLSQGISQSHQQTVQSSQTQQPKPVQQTQQQSQNPQSTQSLQQQPQQQMQTVQHQPQVSQQQQMQPQSQHQTQVQQSNSHSPQLSNSMSPFSNRMSPMSSYAHMPQASNKIGMNTTYGGTMCGAMATGIRGAYPSQTGGSSPIATGCQVQPSTMQNGNQPPRYMQQQQQQMMGSVSMMRTQMIGHSSQMMTRPPPPEYRQTPMLQQHQSIMGQSMPQNMSQMHQGIGQLSYQNMRPVYRPSMAGNPMTNMAGGQMIGGINQQSIPANIPSMKASMMSPNMNIPVTMGQGNVGPNGPMSGNGMSVTMNQVSSGANIARPAMMQHTRSPNVNMGMSNLGMSTQMPPSRPEWRQMMMPQGQNGGLMNPNIRHGYNQAQQGSMMNQGGQMISMQRSQPHLMGMMNMQNGPAMQHNPNMNSSASMQGGNVSISAAMHNPSIQSGMSIGGRMSQHNLVMGQQGQIRMGMQMNPQGIPDSHQSSMGPNQVGASTNINQMSSTTGPIGHHGGANVNPNISQMGSGNMTVMNSMNNPNLNPLTQVSGCNGSHVNSLNQNGAIGNLNPMNAHPRSPATLGQMHPCSPVASGGGTSGGPSRPLSNPGLGLSTPQPQNINCSQSSSGSSSPMMQQQCSTSQSQMRQNMGGNIPSVRTSNSIGQVSQGHPVQGMGVISQNSTPSQMNQSLGQCGNSGLPTNPNVLMNKSGNNVVTSVGSSGTQRPDSGSSVMKSSQPPTPNPPSSSASNDFDLIFNNEGEFAALLH